MLYKCAKGIKEFGNIFVLQIMQVGRQAGSASAGAFFVQTKKNESKMRFATQPFSNVDEMRN